MAQQKYRLKQRCQLVDARAEIVALKQQLAYMTCEKVCGVLAYGSSERLSSYNCHRCCCTLAVSLCTGHPSDHYHHIKLLLRS